MPEGDTIFRAARTLHRALQGEQVTGFVSVYPALMRHSVIGQPISGVSSVGKHLLIGFGGGLVLRTHMRMNGSWHLYRRGARWRRPRGDMRIVITTAALEAVGFSIPVAEFIQESELARHEPLAALGPDILDADFDPAEALRRMRAAGTAEIAEVLLNQRVLAGIGNVYKSEILFTCRVNPFSPANALDDAVLEGLVATAVRFLRANVSDTRAPMTTYTGFRRTTNRANPSERLWVYGRAGKPCRRCGEPIRMRRQGAHARSTYWCPGCQR